MIAAIVILVQQVLASLSTKNERFETLAQGDITPLIEDSCLNLDNMRKTGITRERAFSQLRSESIRHLGEVKRLYFEAGGTFTLIKNYDEVPGLPILPFWDKEYQEKVSSTCEEQVCEKCGKHNDGDSSNKQCPNCKNDTFVHAVR